ncbi:hypothetical protein BDV19DRAFT_375599 [Aspergillus venezuelensis]
MSGRRSALVLYGSETGNAQDVAEEVSAVAERLHFSTQVSELNHVKPESLKSHTIVIFAVSTTGQGDLPANARTFWRSLLLKKLPPTFLSGVRFTWFGLGDSSYPKFNWAARKLYKRLLQLGAEEIYPGGEADHQHPEGYNPLPEGQEPIPDDVQLPPKWVLQLQDQNAAPTVEAAVPPTVDEETLSKDFPDSYRLDHDIRPLHDSFTATLTQNKRVTPQTHFQDVRHLTLTVSEPLSYSPGDVIAITPKNTDEDVQSLIDMMGWQEQADSLVSLVPRDNNTTHNSEDQPTPPIHNLFSHPNLTLRSLLTNYLDIRAIPRRSFFSSIAHYTTYEMHKERLLEFTNPEFLDEFWDYTTRPRRSILEILHEFDTVKIPWQHATTAFPILRGRQFSITSGGELKRTPSGGARFDLLIAIVKYRTVIKKIREGVCTKYISNLRPGSTIRVQLQRGGLNSSVAQLVGPTLLIGPGTGVAPLRSMLWEKAALVKSYREENPGINPPIEPTILLYGGRNRESDFFFEEEYNTLSDLIKLRVLTAFSRDQKNKVYVQDVISQHSATVFNLLHDKGGAVFVCGSSGRMPQAVREALTEVFQGGNDVDNIGFTRREAEDYLVGMEKTGRYKQETCGLRILVPVKRVIDYAIKPRINKAQTGVETAGVKHSLNPFDELSVEEAVRLRERKGPLKVDNILALSAGGPKCGDTLRTAMAMGADRAFHIDVPEGNAGDGGLEPLTVAKTLKAVVEKENINLVLLGKQAIDGDQGQTGQMLAGLLGWPQATQASKVEVKDEAGTVEVTHEVDGGVETLKAKLPMIITTDLRLNEPRYASLPNIMKAKKKPLEKMTLADLGVEDKRRLKTLKVTEPPARQGGGKVEDVDGLVAKLKELGAL